MIEKQESRRFDKPTAPREHNDDTEEHNASSRQQAYDVAAGCQRRRAAAVRIIDGDPANPGTRYHKPSTGLRAAGYRQGYLAALRWVLSEHGAQLDDVLRAKLSAVVKRGENR